MGWTRKSAAVSVLLAMEQQRKEAGQRVRQLREQRQWTAEDLAHHAGLAVKTISRFENGRHEGRQTTVRKIAKALDVSEQEITGPPPAPLGLGHNGSVPSELADLLAATQDRLASVEEELRLLRAESAAADAEVLARIEAVHRAIEGPPQR